MTNPYEWNWRMPGVPRDESPARSGAAGAFREPFDLQRGPHDPAVAIGEPTSNWIVVAGAQVSNHPPPDHVAVAAINRIGEVTHLHVSDGPLEKGFAVGATCALQATSL